MIVVLKPDVGQERKSELIHWLESRALRVDVSEGEYQTVLGAIGDTSAVDLDLVRGMEGVDKVTRVTEPFRRSDRRTHPEDLIVRVGKSQIGGGHFALIAGPCSVESEEQIVAVAKAVKAAGADMLRGGAFKPRTSPYTFSGLKAKGLELLRIAKEETGLPIVSELMDVRSLDLYEDVDVIQVGARNMQNYDLLHALGRVGKPVLLKRGIAATLEELLLSAEHIIASGNERVILCERGIRTFSDYARNTLDLTAVPALHELSRLPVIVDPSHATGIARMVPPMALAATAAGADGVMIEVHNDPMNALCDGAQALRPEGFESLARKIRQIRKVVCP
ncbi:MAG: 3-deoxy-7-phosphoheptulonate synthase [Oscillospiraceae bacterium]|nr:3-deoxy-7-phosphoheptulonate synthase [Oscillospiraceae bacterium]